MNDMTEQDKMLVARAALQTALAGKSPRQRGIEKVHAALNWIYRWGWSSPSTIDLVGGAAAHGLAARMVKRGLLIKTRTEAGGGLKGVPAWILTLSQSGLEEIERVRETLLPYELNPYKIRQDQLRHYQLAQNATAKKLKSGAISKFSTEKELSERSQQGIKQPDILWYLPDGSRMAIEVELSAKWARELDEFVLACLLALSFQKPDQKPRFDLIAIVSDSKAIIKRYQNAFAPGATFDSWEKDSQRRWQRKEQKTVPDWSTTRIKWLLID